jgi:protein-tyrosine phosphatase
MDTKSTEENYNRWCIGQEILSRLYLGSYPSSLNKDWLKETKITHIISCREIKHNNEFAGIKYIDVIMHDIESQKLAEPCETIFKHIQQILSEKENCILIHCTAGVSRSAAAVIYCVMKTQKCNYSKAVDLVSKKRPCICPNSSFVEQLKKLVI